MTLDQLLDSIVVQPNGCWTTTYTARTTGYAVGKIDGRVRLLHRYIYTAFVGDPGSLDLHHRCGNKECLNFGHLDTLTRSQHVVEHGQGERSRAAFSRTHCHRGHLLEWSEAQQRKVCRVCVRERWRRWREQRQQ